MYLNSLSFTQSHTLTDTRLALGYLAFAICAACFYWDYKLGFEDTKVYTAIAVAAYTAINGFLTFWIWGVEKGTVYVGTNKAGDKIEISSSTKKHVPIYNVTIVTTSEKGDRKEVKLSKPFREWFNAKGQFVTVPFQEIFASNVALIGEADPKRVVESKKKGRGVKGEESKSMDDKWASLLAESAGDAEAETTATPSKGTKRRGKKA